MRPVFGRVKTIADGSAPLNTGRHNCRWVGTFDYRSAQLPICRHSADGTAQTFRSAGQSLDGVPSREGLPWAEIFATPTLCHPERSSSRTKCGDRDLQLGWDPAQRDPPSLRKMESARSYQITRPFSKSVKGRSTPKILCAMHSLLEGRAPAVSAFL